MKNDSISLINFWTENKKIIRFYLLLAGVTAIGSFLFLLLEGKMLLATVLAGGFLSLWLITQPKIALYQFLFVMFTNYLFMEQPVILLVDISALLVIITALFDIFLKGEFQLSFPKLSFNFVIIIIAFFVIAVNSYEISLTVMPILHISFLFATFISLYRLSGYVKIQKLLHLFFVLAVMHAFITILPLLGGSKVERLFGFAHSTLDDIMMIAFPIGLVFFIRSSQKTFFYLLSLLAIIGALIATQSRLSIMFALIFGVVAVYLSVDKKRIKTYKRIKFILHSSVSFVLLLLILKPEFLTALLDRFELLFHSSPSDTFLIRIVLWTNALTTFADNPVFGIGLGHYKILSTIYSSIHLHYMFPYTLGYSAHNMFFHYLAESGIVGTTAVFALIINQFRLAFKVYKKKKTALSDVDISLFVIALLILVTSFIEAGWLWGQIGYIFIFFIVLIIRNFTIHNTK